MVNVGNDGKITQAGLFHPVILQSSELILEKESGTQPIV